MNNHTPEQVQAVEKLLNFFRQGIAFLDNDNSPDIQTWKDNLPCVIYKLQGYGDGITRTVTGTLDFSQQTVKIEYNVWLGAENQTKSKHFELRAKPISLLDEEIVNPTIMLVVVIAITNAITTMTEELE